jgi:hypothetical protein
MWHKLWRQARCLFRSTVESAEREKAVAAGIVRGERRVAGDRRNQPQKSRKITNKSENRL